MDALGVHEVLRYMQRYPWYEHISMFVETGTTKGQTALQMCAVFDSVTTIEASDKLFTLMQRAYAKTKVNFLHGESHVVLASLREDVGWMDEPWVIFLDAHWYKSGAGDAIYNKNPAPILQELEALYPRETADLIIVDDSRLFGQKTDTVDWVHITEESILQTIGEDTLVDFYEENDRYLLFRKSGRRGKRGEPVVELAPVEVRPESKFQQVGEFF